MINEHQGALIPEPVCCQFMLHTGATLSIDSSSSNSINCKIGNGSIKGVGGEKYKDQGSSMNGKELGIATEESRKDSKPQPARLTISLSEVLDVSKEEKKRHETQITVGRAIVMALEDVDGFRYPRRRNWETKARDGLRISYVCSESLQNHDRVSNRPRKKLSIDAHGSSMPDGNGSDSINGEQMPGIKRTIQTDSFDGCNTLSETVATNIQPKLSNNSAGKYQNKKLPTYDCCGNIVVKFLALQQCIVIIYKHNSIHRKVLRRAEGEMAPAASKVDISLIPAGEKPKRKRTEGAAKK